MVGRRRKLYGVGVNDSDYITQKLTNGGREICPFYARWRDMLRRCYSEKFQATAKTYIGCSVHPDWHSFMTFRAWMVEQNWYGKVLDKDILIDGNKIYSEESCVFITAKTNSFLLDCVARRGGFPIGVSLGISGVLPYTSRVRVDGKSVYLGSYPSPEEAHQAWRVAKYELAVHLASEQSDPRVAEALLKRYKVH